MPDSKRHSPSQEGGRGEVKTSPLGFGGLENSENQKIGRKKDQKIGRKEERRTGSTRTPEGRRIYNMSSVRPSSVWARPSSSVLRCPFVRRRPSVQRPSIVRLGSSVVVRPSSFVRRHLFGPLFGP